MSGDLVYLDSSVALRTILDALHLATALLLGEPVVVASHDQVMKDVAGHLGLGVVDPVELTG